MIIIEIIILLIVGISVIVEVKSIVKAVHIPSEILFLFFGEHIRRSACQGKHGNQKKDDDHDDDSYDQTCMLPLLRHRIGTVRVIIGRLIPIRRLSTVTRLIAVGRLSAVTHALLTLIIGLPAVAGTLLIVIGRLHTVAALLTPVRRLHTIAGILLVPVRRLHAIAGILLVPIRRLHAIAGILLVPVRRLHTIAARLTAVIRLSAVTAIPIISRRINIVSRIGRIGRIIFLIVRLLLTAGKKAVGIYHFRLYDLRCCGDIRRGIDICTALGCVGIPVCVLSFLFSLQAF